MITVTLPNSSGPPLDFEGTVRFTGKVSTEDGKRHLFLTIYQRRKIEERVANDSRRNRQREEIVRYAYSIIYDSSWPQEVPHYLSSEVDSVDEMLKRLESIDPSKWVHYRGGNDAMRDSILTNVRERWKSLVATASQHKL